MHQMSKMVNLSQLNDFYSLKKSDSGHSYVDSKKVNFLKSWKSNNGDQRLGKDKEIGKDQSRLQYHSQVKGLHSDVLWANIVNNSALYASE